MTLKLVIPIGFDDTELVPIALTNHPSFRSCRASLRSLIGRQRDTHRRELAPLTRGECRQDSHFDERFGGNHQEPSGKLGWNSRWLLPFESWTAATIERGNV